MNSTVEGRNMEHTKSPLELLDELDEFRRGHQNGLLHPSDWCMRCMEAIVASACGFESRRDWNEALSADPSTRSRVKNPILKENQGGNYLRRVKKRCNNCRHSYWQKDFHGVSPKTGLVQLCRNPAYRSPTYTEAMMLADSARNYCRFWAPKPGKGTSK